MFSHSLCDPFKPDPIHLGTIQPSEFLEAFNKVPWTEYLAKMKHAKENSIYYSPSLEFTNETTKHAVCISCVENEPGPEFYIFYRRPKTRTRLFGLIKSYDPQYLTDRTGQSRDDAHAALRALASNDVDTLEKRWG